ncbi:MAG: sulfatase-like hydrolase/transferase [Verrucomicrobiota bacterium]
MPKPPNILFLMSDEHRADVAGFAGDPVVRTPVLDELARTGVVFQNAYTPSPICIPGRQCMMTGKLPRTIGCEWFGQDLAPDAMTFAKRFSQEAWARPFAAASSIMSVATRCRDGINASLRICSSTIVLSLIATRPPSRVWPKRIVAGNGPT